MIHKSFYDLEFIKKTLMHKLIEIQIEQSAYYDSQRFKYQYKSKYPPSSMHQNKKFVSIEGNIGSGKSTILKIIREHFPHLSILDEPLSSWEKVGEQQDVNLLGMYYSDPKRWGFTFQIYALFTRLKKWAEYTNMRSSGIKISERSLLSDRYVFASIMKDMDLLNQPQYEIYLQCYRDMIKMNNITDVKGIIYIQCDPITCAARIKKRNREGEGQIPLDYLQRLHQKHQQWLNSHSKSFLEENTSKSSHSGHLSDSDQNSQQSQFTSSEKSSCSKTQSKFQIEDPQNSSLFSWLQKSKKSIKETSICTSFNPHLDQQIANSEFHSRDKTNYERNRTSRNQKVLVIDNTQAIDRNEIIRQINNWLIQLQAE